MAITTTYEGATLQVPPSDSAVSWAAVFAGALAAAVLSLLLFTLGIGLGLSSVSVWSTRGADGETVGWAAVAWIAFTQLASAGVGGYVAGRLRTRWQGVHADEVYFRDTAHGFLSWALATLLMVALMGFLSGAAVTGTAKAAGAVASGVGSAAAGVAGTAATAATGAAAATAGKVNEQQGADMSYWIGHLLRKSESTEAPMQQATADADRTAPRAPDHARDAAVVFAHSLRTGSLSDEDARYLGRLIAPNAGLSPEDAEKRVRAAFDQVKQQAEQARQAVQQAEDKAKAAAEEARKATAYSLLWMFVALLVGAFVGSLAATFGGRQRDVWPTH